jgi:outer membrane protein assembly factor BamA
VYAAEAAGASIRVGDSAFFSCQCDKKVLNCVALGQWLKERRDVPPVAGVRNFLDSLGFFSAQWDTLPGGRYSVNPGDRASVASERITGTAAITLDSLSPFGCPRPYDAGEIRERVTEIGRRLTEKGFPFAAVSVSIAPIKTDTARAASVPGERLTVVYSVRPDRRCLFAAPRLIGALSTRRSLLFYDMQVKKGELFDSRKIEATEDALRRRPYIAYAEAGTVAVLPYELRERNDTAVSQDVEYVSVPFYLKDRTGLGIEGALALNSRQGGGTFLQGDLTLSFLNLFHSGERASMVYGGDKTYQKFHVDAAKPWLFGAPLTASASFGLEVHENGYGYLSGETAAMVELQKRWNAGLGVKGSETTLDQTGQSWRYFGADFRLVRLPERLKDGFFASELSLAAGGGIAERERNHTRSQVEFAGGIHAPLLNHQAVRLRIVYQQIITDEDTLADAEQYRVGGYRSVRGYFENEFAFRTVAYDQLDYMYYFSAAGSAYVFLDDGFGFAQSLTKARWGDRTEFLGYGLGIHIPARLGTLTLEWARNRSDTKSWGRINVQVSNNTTAE